MDLGLSGRAVLVVGASGTIGATTVDAMAAEGALVAVAGRDRARLIERFAERRGVHACVEMDLTSDASVDRGVAEAEDVLGTIDVLVVSVAGDVPFGSIWQANRSHWDETTALKLAGITRLCTAVGSRMAARGRGTIVNLVGVAADIVVLSNPVGSAVNAALKHLTRTLAGELAAAGVRVVGISPGIIAGPRAERFGGAAREELGAAVPMGRIGSSAEVAALVAFVASPKASYVTGEVIAVDGGMSLLGLQGRRVEQRSA